MKVKKSIKSQIWEGLGLHLGRVWDDLGRLLGALGPLLGVFGAFGIDFVSSMGPR